MRTPFIAPIIISCTLMCSCAKDEKTNTETLMREGIRYVAEHYPAATLQDIYKTCYQDYFGSEHMLPDSASARNYLNYELANIGGDTMLMPLTETTGWRHRYERISLQNILDSTMSEGELLNRFLDASNRSLAGDSSEWANEWKQLEAIALEISPEWADSTLQEELRWCADSCYAVRHSQSFRETYKPHYRIVCAKEK